MPARMHDASYPLATWRPTMELHAYKNVPIIVTGYESGEVEKDMALLMQDLLGVAKSLYRSPPIRFVTYIVGSPGTPYL
jgi:hypothetical protein